MSKKPKVIYASDQLYRLLDDAARGLVLEVVCGTAAVYTVQMVLNAEEKKQYQAGGNGFLDKLAAEVFKTEAKLRKEGRTVPVT